MRFWRVISRRDRGEKRSAIYVLRFKATECWELSMGLVRFRLIEDIACDSLADTPADINVYLTSYSQLKVPETLLLPKPSQQLTPYHYL